jgi:hypothetical protein
MTSPLSNEASQITTPSAYPHTTLLPPSTLYAIKHLSTITEVFSYINEDDSYYYTEDQLARYHQNATEDYVRMELDTTKIYSPNWKLVKSKDGTENCYSYDYLLLRDNGYIKNVRTVVVVNNMIEMIDSTRKAVIATSKEEAKRATIVFKNSLGAPPKEKESTLTAAIKFGKPIFPPKKETTANRNDAIKFGNIVFQPQKGVIKLGKQSKTP